MPELIPHPGPQTQYLASPADIAVYGGAAGGGKTWAILADMLRHVHRPGFHGVVFRRTSEQVTNAGGLWDEAEQLYPQFGGKGVSYRLKWTWRVGADVKFANMQYEASKLNYQGAQIAVIAFDELTHFSQSMFFYMLSRARTKCGIRPYIRGTCNPDADSWLAEFLSWWIDQETGFPIPERSGVLRWMFRHDDRVYWFDSREAAGLAMQAKSLKPMPKSATFIPAHLSDNPTVDPEYEASLMAMQLVDRERLLNGNWKIRETAGFLFNRSWFRRFLRVRPVNILKAVRYWDMAGTEDGDWSAGVLMAQLPDRTYVILDIVHGQWTPAARDAVIRQTAELDRSEHGDRVQTFVEQEGGSGGKAQAAYLVRDMAEFGVRSDRPETNKIARSKLLSAQVEAGNVALVESSAWNRKFIDEADAFAPDCKHDDMVDAASGAFKKLTQTKVASGSMPRGIKTHARY